MALGLLGSAEEGPRPERGGVGKRQLRERVAVEVCTELFRGGAGLAVGEDEDAVSHCEGWKVFFGGGGGWGGGRCAVLDNKGFF